MAGNAGEGPGAGDGPTGRAVGPASTPRPSTSSSDGAVAGATGRVPAPRPDHHLPRLRILGVVAAILLLAGLVGVFLLEREGEGADVSGGGPAASTTTDPDTATTGDVFPVTTPDRDPETTTTAGRPAARDQPDAITLLFAGDLLPHTPLVAKAAEYGRASNQPYDLRPMLAPMAPVVKAADVAICHMETPVAPDQSDLSGYPAFGAPVQMVEAAKDVGYDGCSNASNHSLDKGRAGIAATLDAFDRLGLHHSGMARTPEEAAAIPFYDVHHVKVAHLSYAYDFNGYRIPADAPWAVDKIDVAKIHADAAEARKQGADLVVVSLHWGTQYVHDPDRYQRDVAAALLPSPDIDLIVGAHAHVVQPIDLVEGTYVIWGLGNQLANQPEVGRSDGLTAIATAEPGRDGRWKVTGIEGVPTFNDTSTFQVFPIVRTLRDAATPPALREQLIASYDRSAPVILRNHTPGVTVTPRP
jgi:poly-gamma-glutamate synthesis protein (capsule biosynthesis protein)